MPTIKTFSNCRITMYGLDHNPPHFHLVMNDGRQTLFMSSNRERIRGQVPSREVKEALAWAEKNVSLLSKKNWEELQK